MKRVVLVFVLVVGALIGAPAAHAGTLSGKTVLFAGDSLTVGFFATTNADSYYGLTRSWLESEGAVVLDRLPYPSPRIAANVATAAPAITAAGADVFVLEIGTNDAAPAHLTAPAEFAASVTTILDAARAGNPDVHIVVCSIWRGVARRDSYNAVLRAAAAASDARYVDLSAVSDDPANTGPAGLPTWCGPSDNWHPNDLGHATIYGLVRQAIVDSYTPVIAPPVYSRSTRRISRLRVSGTVQAEGADVRIRVYRRDRGEWTPYRSFPAVHGGDIYSASVHIRKRGRYRVCARVMETAAWLPAQTAFGPMVRVR